MTKGAQQELFETYYYKGWNKGNDSVLTALLDPNVEFRGSFQRKPLKGPSAFLEYMHKAHKALGTNVIQIEELVVSENGTKAALRLKNRGVHKSDFFGVKATGFELAWTSAAFFTIANNLSGGLVITKIWVLGDIDGIKNQIGALAETTTGF